MGEEIPVSEDDLKTVYLYGDDKERHYEGCLCGFCNSNGHSYGVGIFPMKRDEKEVWISLEEWGRGDPLMRVYGPSQEAAVESAIWWCRGEGYNIWEIDINPPEEELLSVEEKKEEIDFSCPRCGNTGIETWLHFQHQVGWFKNRDLFLDPDLSLSPYKVLIAHLPSHHDVVLECSCARCKATWHPTTQGTPYPQYRWGLSTYYRGGDGVYRTLGGDFYGGS